MYMLCCLPYSYIISKCIYAIGKIYIFKYFAKPTENLLERR